MNYILIFLIISVSLYGKSNVKIELIADHEVISPGSNFRIAIKAKMSNEWYIYWKNPGDAGLATAFEWNIPDGVKLVSEKWQTPEKIFFQDMASYGYKKEAYLYFTFHLSEDMPLDTAIDINVCTRWLECKEKCIPGSSENNIKLIISNTLKAINQNIFDEMASKTPAIASDWKFKSRKKNNTILIDIYKPEGFENYFDELTFIPNENGLFHNGSKQLLTKTEYGYSLSLKLDPLRLEDPKRVEGVLIANRSFYYHNDNNSIIIDVDTEK
jgi:DsbC/DsbD-like thiol-disulfide interchange protein